MPPRSTFSPVRISTPVDGWGQHKKRGEMILFDQHGRAWWTSTEIQVDPSITPQPVGELMAVTEDIDDGEGETIKGWQAPWYPEPKYMLMSASQRVGNRFKIKYQLMIADYREATEAYYQRAAVEAAAHNLPIPSYGAPIMWKLRQIVGMPPKSPKVPEAAMAGDKWLLGSSQEKNVELARYMYTGQKDIATPEEAIEQEAKQEFSQAEIDAAVAVLRQGKKQSSSKTPTAA